MSQCRILDRVFLYPVTALKGFPWSLGVPPPPTFGMGSDEKIKIIFFENIFSLHDRYIFIFLVADLSIVSLPVPGGVDGVRSVPQLIKQKFFENKFSFYTQFISNK